MKVNIIKSLKYHNQRRDLSMRHFLILILSIMALSVATNNNNAEAKMFNKFKKGFYFEKYETEEEAKSALLELHPIGSDVEGLIRTLNVGGAEISKEDLNSYYNYKQFGKREDWWKNSMKDIYKIKYSKASPFFVILNWIEWDGTIQTDQDGKIVDLGIHKGRAY